MGYNYNGMLFTDSSWKLNNYQSAGAHVDNDSSACDQRESRIQETLFGFPFSLSWGFGIKENGSSRNQGGKNEMPMTNWQSLNKDPDVQSWLRHIPEELQPNMVLK